MSNPIPRYPYCDNRLALLHIQLSNPPPSPAQCLSSPAATAVAHGLINLALWLFETTEPAHLLSKIQPLWPAYSRWISAFLTATADHPQLVCKPGLPSNPFCDSNTIFFKPDMAGTHDIAFSAFMLLDAIVSIAPATTAQTGGRIMPLNQWFHENLTKLLIRAWSSVQLIQAPFARLGAEILFSLITRSMDTTPATIDLIFHSLKATLQASDKELTHFLVGTISSLTNLDTRLDDISNGMHSLLYFHDNPSTRTEDCNPLQLSLAHGGMALACDVLRRITPSARARQIAPRASNLQRLFCIGCFSSYLTLSFLKSPYWAMKALDQGLLLSVAKFLHLLEPGQLEWDFAPMVTLLHVLARLAVYRGVSLRLSNSLQRIRALRLDGPLRDIGDGGYSESSKLDDRGRVLEVWESLKVKITFEEKARALYYAGRRTERSQIVCSNKKCSNQDHLFSDLADPRTRYKRCAQCSIPCYCSRECQKADWMDGHAEACKKFSIQLLDGIPPPPIESSLERSYIYDRIALDAQLYKGDIKSLYASHCDSNSNATAKPIYVGIDFTTAMLNSKPRIWILGEDEVPDEREVALVLQSKPSKPPGKLQEQDVSSPVFLVGRVSGDGVDHILLQEMPPSVLF